MADSAQVIVVGAGHNGLICAAYLARAGIDTLLVEARASVGGCATTEADLGARFNICNCDHVLIRAMPVLDELDLEAHGLRYLEPDSGFVHLFHDDSEPWIHFSDVERTIDGLAHTYPNSVAAYRRYLDDAMPVAELVVDMARTHGRGGEMLRRAVGKRGNGAVRLLDWSRRSANEVLRRYFDDWHVTMPAVATGPSVWGVSPDMPGTGLAAALYATRHLVTSGRPEGGSGALTDAVGASFTQAGGQLRCDARVEKLLIDEDHVAGVRLATGETLTAPVVVAASDPHRTFVDWLDEVPLGAQKLVDKWRDRPVHDGYESKIDAVLSGRPRYRAADRLAEVYPGVDSLSATAAVSPTPSQLAEAHALRAVGRVADFPTFLVNVPSVLDPAMKSGDGLHILSLETLFTPYALEGGWPGSPEPQRWLDLWLDLVEPGSVQVERFRAMTPDRYEAEFFMHRGHTPAYAGSPLAALVGREREVTRYRTPIEGLYLTGAGTFPGAGIFGASGRNAAAAVLRDLGSQSSPRLGAGGPRAARSSASARGIRSRIEAGARERRTR